QERDDAGVGHGPDSIPQSLHVPAVVVTVVVQVPDRTAARLHPPVLAITPVGPPPALDPPPPDHVGHLVPAPAPDERRGHPRIAFDPNLDLLVVPLGHRRLLDHPRALSGNRTYVREGESESTPSRRHESSGGSGQVPRAWRGRSRWSGGCF